MTFAQKIIDRVSRAFFVSRRMAGTDRPDPSGAGFSLGPPGHQPVQPSCLTRQSLQRLLQFFDAPAKLFAACSRSSSLSGWPRFRQPRHRNLRQRVLRRAACGTHVSASPKDLRGVDQRKGRPVFVHGQSLKNPGNSVVPSAAPVSPASAFPCICAATTTTISRRKGRFRRP